MNARSTAIAGLLAAAAITLLPLQSALAAPVSPEPVVPVKPGHAAPPAWEIPPVITLPPYEPPTHEPPTRVPPTHRPPTLVPPTYVPPTTTTPATPHQPPKRTPKYPKGAPETGAGGSAGGVEPAVALAALGLGAGGLAGAAQLARRRRAAAAGRR